MAGGKGYAKVYRRIWTDEKFRKLDAMGKLVALYALTSQSNRIGLFRFSKALAAEETGMTRDRLDTVWGTVCHTLSWGWDEGVSTVWVPSWWKWNPPDNPSAIKGYLSDLDDVPTCSLIACFGNNLRHLPDTVWGTVGDTVSDRVGDTVSPPEPYPEPEPKPEQDHENPTPLVNAVDRGGEDQLPKGNGQVNGADSSNGEEALASWLTGFDEWWETYPRKVAREAARKAYAKIRPRTDLTYTALFTGVEHHKRTEWEGREPDKIPHASTWLNQRRWTDAAQSF